MLGGAAPGLDRFCREVSFGTINLTGSVVLGWYTLPNPRSYYGYGSPLDRPARRPPMHRGPRLPVLPGLVGVNLISTTTSTAAPGRENEHQLDGQSAYRGNGYARGTRDRADREQMGQASAPTSRGLHGTYDSRWT